MNPVQGSSVFKKKLFTVLLGVVHLPCIITFACVCVWRVLNRLSSQGLPLLGLHVLVLPHFPQDQSGHHLLLSLACNIQFRSLIHRNHSWIYIQCMCILPPPTCTYPHVHVHVHVHELYMSFEVYVNYVHVYMNTMTDSHNNISKPPGYG